LGFGLGLGFVFLAAGLAHISPGLLLRRALVALPFALAAVSVVFTLPGAPVASFRLGSWTLVATDAGVFRFTSILLRSWLSVQMAILLTLTTQFPDVVHALRHLHLPGVLVSIIAFMYRYLFVLTDEVVRLRRAREARRARLPGRPGGGKMLWRAKVAGGMAGQLFLRSFSRSDRVYQAMLSRGYRGELLTMNPHASAIGPGSLWW